MSTHETTQPRPEDGERCSAYLLGDLDPDETATFEERLASEPDLVVRLESTRELLEALHAADTPEPPEGAAARLRERLASERRAREPASLDAARARRVEYREPRPWIGVAASVAALALVSGGAIAALRGGAGDEASVDAGQEGADTAAEDAVDDAGEAPASGREFAGAEADDEGAATAEAGDDGGEEFADVTDAATAAATDAPAGDTFAASAPPLLAESGLSLADADSARLTLTAVPEATELLGTDAASAESLALDYAAAIRAADAFGSGATPGDCLDVALEANPGAVPVRVESLSYQGDEALAYVLVLPVEGTLSEVEALLVTPTTCATILSTTAQPSE